MVAAVLCFWSAADAGQLSQPLPAAYFSGMPYLVAVALSLTAGTLLALLLCVGVPFWGVGGWIWLLFLGGPSRHLLLQSPSCRYAQTLIHEMARVMGVEARAVMNINLYHLHHGGRGGNCTAGGPGGVGAHCTGNITDLPTRGGFLSIYGPTINIIRDPR